MTIVTCEMYPDCPYNVKLECVNKTIRLDGDRYGHMDCYSRIDMDEIMMEHRYCNEVNLTAEAATELLNNKEVAVNLTEEQKHVLENLTGDST